MADEFSIITSKTSHDEHRSSNRNIYSFYCFDLYDLSKILECFRGIFITGITLSIKLRLISWEILSSPVSAVTRALCFLAGRKCFLFNLDSSDKELCFCDKIFQSFFCLPELNKSFSIWKPSFFNCHFDKLISCIKLYYFSNELSFLFSRHVFPSIPYTIHSFLFIFK